MADDDKESSRRNKQQRKMTKVLAKAWNLDNASPFRQDKLSSSFSQPIDLQTIGQKLDNGGYEHGRSGWECFARDLGGVYQRHILFGLVKPIYASAFLPSCIFKFPIVISWIVGVWMAENFTSIEKLRQYLDWPY